ncbi:MAG TPA: hypothetical protein DD465_16575 [Thalassospira sp.]|nr:hypothetical protein KO164_1860 [Thalassospira sp. KO164]PXX32635.1 hypothetical protein C7967_104114 [Thalassospira sp. 11-3]SEE19055.1 hypothetical protein SAMN04515623_1873 [Thalassospira permensis]HBN50742.1 hypothetical protein [Thalassospira sp.]
MIGGSNGPGAMDGRLGLYCLLAFSSRHSNRISDVEVGRGGGTGLSELWQGATLSVGFHGPQTGRGIGIAGPGGPINDLRKAKLLLLVVGMAFIFPKLLAFCRRTRGKFVMDRYENRKC